MSGCSDLGACSTGRDIAVCGHRRTCTDSSSWRSSQPARQAAPGRLHWWRFPPVSAAPGPPAVLLHPAPAAHASHIQNHGQLLQPVQRGAAEGIRGSATSIVMCRQRRALAQLCGVVVVAAARRQKRQAGRQCNPAATLTLLSSWSVENASMASTVGWSCGRRQAGGAAGQARRRGRGRARSQVHFGSCLYGASCTLMPGIALPCTAGPHLCCRGACGCRGRQRGYKRLQPLVAAAVDVGSHQKGGTHHCGHHHRRHLQRCHICSSGGSAEEAAAGDTCH